MRPSIEINSLKTNIIMARVLKDGEGTSHAAIKQFKERCQHYIDSCNIALSGDFDSSEANIYITHIMSEHNFRY
jgi:hypothetical protein